MLLVPVKSRIAPGSSVGGILEQEVAEGTENGLGLCCLRFLLFRIRKSWLRSLAPAVQKIHVCPTKTLAIALASLVKC